MKRSFSFYAITILILAILLSSCLVPEGPDGDPTATAQPIFPPTLSETQDPLQPQNPTPTPQTSTTRIPFGSPNWNICRKTPKCW